MPGVDLGYPGVMDEGIQQPRALATPARGRRAARAAVVLAAAAAAGVLSVAPPAAAQSRGQAAAPPPPAAERAADAPQPLAAPPPGFEPPPVAAPPPSAAPPDMSSLATVASMEQQLREAQQQLREAKERDDDEGVRRWKEEMKRLREAIKEEKDRNWVRQSPGMMAGGITLTAVGTVGFCASLIVGLTAAFETGSDRERLGTIALVSTTLSLASIGAGIPLALIGSKRVPASSIEAAAPTVLVGPRGAGLRWRF